MNQKKNIRKKNRILTIILKIINQRNINQINQSQNIIIKKIHQKEKNRVLKNIKCNINKN